MKSFTKKYQKEKFELAYSIYLAIKGTVKGLQFDSSSMSYVARTFGQLIYNKFGKEVIGISENAIKENPEKLTEDHFNNCQKVGEFLAISPILSKEDFQKLINESRKTIKVTKGENSSLRKFQKNKDYGKGLEAYREAGIVINFF